MPNGPLIPSNLMIDNRTDRDLTIAFELRDTPGGKVVCLVISEREQRSAAGLIVPRGNTPIRVN